MNKVNNTQVAVNVTADKSTVLTRRRTVDLVGEKVSQRSNWRVFGSGEDCITETTVVYERHELLTIIKIVLKHMELKDVFDLFNEVVKDWFAKQ